MARYLDEHGCGSIVLSEHHVSEDGYLTSPMMLAGAVAAATAATPIVVAVTLLPLHDPVRLAEDIIELDHLSEGRAMVVLGVGYRPVEYELYGVDFHRRGEVADTKLARLLDLLDAAHEGRDAVRVTPAPFTSPRPLLAWGGGSRAAARRAGRHGIGFFAQSNAPGLEADYLTAAASAGHPPGLCILPSPEAPYTVFVANDLDTGWDEVGDALLADAVAYHQWNASAGTDAGTASLSAASTVGELRRLDAAHRVVTPEGAAAIVAEHGFLAIHPLCGGLEPDLSWQYLERAVAVTAR